MSEIESKSSYKTSRSRGRVKYKGIFTRLSILFFSGSALAVSGISRQS